MLNLSNLYRCRKFVVFITLGTVLGLGDIAVARNINYLTNYFNQLANGSNKHIAGLYGSRTLSVPNPEIYLQSDTYFLDGISQLSGLQEAFFLTPEEINPINGYNPDHQFSSGPPFSYSDVKLNNRLLVPAREKYSDSYPFLPWFDRRMAPISDILKSEKVNSIEKASLLYFQKKYVQAVDIDTLFIVYCENEFAYVASNGALYDINNSRTQSMAGKPVLIFNEKSVWYPLLGRNDSSKDQYLAALLKTFAIDPCNVPDLETTEAPIIAKISALGIDTSLSSFQRDMILVASGSFDHTGLQRLGSVRHPTPSFDTMTGVLYRFEIRFLASTLSPIADYLGALIKSNNYTSFEAEFHKYNTWGSELWEYGMPTYNIDTGWNHDVGTCRDLSMYSIAAIELSGHEWVRLHGVESASIQHYYAVDITSNIMFDNGYAYSRNGKMFMDDSFYRGGGHDFSTIDQIQTKDGFSTIQITSSTLSYFGTLDIGTLQEALEYLDDNSTIPLMVYGAEVNWDSTKDNLTFSGSTYTYGDRYPVSRSPVSCNQPQPIIPMIGILLFK